MHRPGGTSPVRPPLSSCAGIGHNLCNVSCAATQVSTECSSICTYMCVACATSADLDPSTVLYCYTQWSLCPYSSSNSCTSKGETRLCCPSSNPAAARWDLTYALFGWAILFLPKTLAVLSTGRGLLSCNLLSCSALSMACSTSLSCWDHRSGAPGLDCGGCTTSQRDPNMPHALQTGSPSSPGGSNHPVNLEHWVMRSRPQHLSVSDTQVWPVTLPLCRSCPASPPASVTLPEEPGLESKA